MDNALELVGLAQALVQQQRLSLPVAMHIQQQAAAANIGFVQQLRESGAMTALDVAQFASRAFGYPLFDLQEVDLAQLPQTMVDEALFRDNRLLPLSLRGNRLRVATSDPTQGAVIQTLSFKTGLFVDIVVVEDDKLANLIERVYRHARSIALPMGDAGGGARELTSFTNIPLEADDVSVVKLVHQLLLDGINKGASDIHFEPYEKVYRVRYRIDGQLKEVAQPPLGLKERIASRLKVVSRLDIAEKRVPQDGRLRLVLPDGPAVDFRVSTLPTLFGEKIVLRILDSSTALLTVDRLGLEPAQLAAVQQAIGKSYGMMLVTGPTGSGKTVSLYAFLRLLNQADVNIAAVEDPVEINLPGINQVAVNEKAGLTFASALRAFLRQDPDILMVGEIRDIETADIAIKAAQTGHRVLSTLHTNNAPATLTRLLNMGVAAFNLASSVSLIIAQRLVRRLCDHCKRPEDIPREELLQVGFTESELDGSWLSYGPRGCEQCRNSGYRGRVGVFEVLPVSEAMAHLIMQGGSELDLAALARDEGMLDLRRAGLLKVKRGITSLAELAAVTGD